MLLSQEVDIILVDISLSKESKSRETLTEHCRFHPRRGNFGIYCWHGNRI